MSANSWLANVNVRLRFDKLKSVVNIAQLLFSTPRRILLSVGELEKSIIINRRRDALPPTISHVRLLSGFVITTLDVGSVKTPTTFNNNNNDNNNLKSRILTVYRENLHYI